MNDLKYSRSVFLVVVYVDVVVEVWVNSSFFLSLLTEKMYARST